MPDWFYQPIYKPLVTRLLSAENARRLTMFAMGMQSRSRAGRKVFDLMKYTSSAPLVIPESVRTEVFGLSFPTPIGLAHGIDIGANALPLWSKLGLGFIQIGVVDIESHADYLNEARLLQELQSITSPKQTNVTVSDVIEKVQAHSKRPAPIGVALSASHIIESIAKIEAEADFFSIPCEVADNPQYLSDIRASTEKPILIRLSISENEQELMPLIDNAVQAELNGCIVIDGQESNLIEGGLIHGAHLRDIALSWVSRIVKRYGDLFPVIGSGGILSPDDAIKFFEAGAKLVQLYEGLVYAGPGLPRRILHKMLYPQTPQYPQVYANEVETPGEISNSLGWKLILFVGIILIFGGLAGIIWASLYQLLPYEIEYLQMSVLQLESYFDGRLAGFIFHDRVSYHGTLISYGILYCWIAWFPLHPSRREAWAWWTLFISGTVGALSTYISYVYSGYLDVWYGSMALILIAIFYMGLILSYRTLKKPPTLKSLFKAGSPMWLWSPAGIGRSYLLFWSFTTALAGVLVFYVGMTQVFVREDLAFMQISVEAIRGISAGLIPFIAHDRIGFGVTLFAIGSASFAIVWKGIRPDSKSALIALSLAYFVSNLTAIWVHPIVGYNSLSHLLPFLVKDTAFLFAIFHLYRPMMTVKSTEQFPDV